MFLKWAKLITHHLWFYQCLAPDEWPSTLNTNSGLARWGRDNVDPILQTTYSNTFTWTKTYNSFQFWNASKRLFHGSFLKIPVLITLIVFNVFHFTIIPRNRMGDDQMNQQYGTIIVTFSEFTSQHMCGSSLAPVIGCCWSPPGHCLNQWQHAVVLSFIASSFKLDCI